MSQKRRDEFQVLVKAAHDAIDEYAESRLSGTEDWFPRGLDEAIKNAITELLSFGVEEKPNA